MTAKRLGRRVVGPEIAEKIHPHTLLYIPIHDENVVIDIQPGQLLTYKRFDLIAKYIYAKHRETGIDSEWAVRLYDEHIRVFNNYKEGDGSEKNGIGDFIKTFDLVLDAVSTSGFNENISVIPVDVNNVIIDGAHRVAACLLYEKVISALCIDKTANIYDYRYFMKKGLATKWADAMALEYCRLKENTYIATIFPSAIGKNKELKAILSKYGNICYEKSGSLNNQGPFNLIRQIYRFEPWLGSWDNHFKGAQNKADACFKRNGPTRIFLLETNGLEQVNLAKAEIRDLFKIGNHSIHINDFHKEAIMLAQIFFNKNSIHFINNCRAINYKWIHLLLDSYEELLKSDDVNKENFCIDGSAVMAVYGIREARDLDFLHGRRDELVIDERLKGYHAINSHNDEAHHYTTTRDDIIFNPEHHFYYNGLKFASLKIISDMKKKRKEPKDLIDVEMMRSFLEGSDEAVHRIQNDSDSSHYNRLYWKERIRIHIPSFMRPIAKKIYLRLKRCL